jgi:hypothetical protein
MKIFLVIILGICLFGAGILTAQSSQCTPDSIYHFTRTSPTDSILTERTTYQYQAGRKTLERREVRDSATTVLYIDREIIDYPTVGSPSRLDSIVRFSRTAINQVLKYSSKRIFSYDANGRVAIENDSLFVNNQMRPFVRREYRYGVNNKLDTIFAYSLPAGTLSSFTTHLYDSNDSLVLKTDWRATLEPLFKNSYTYDSANRTTTDSAFSYVNGVWQMGSVRKTVTNPNKAIVSTELKHPFPEFSTKVDYRLNPNNCYSHHVAYRTTDNQVWKELGPSYYIYGTVDVFEVPQAPEMTIAPNPFASYVTLISQQTGSLSVFDLRGTQILQQNVKSQEQISVSTTDWPAGVYFVSVVSAYGTRTVKAIKL